jgi:hypothetical protein
MTMDIPQEIMNHMSDHLTEFPATEANCLAHLLQMYGHAITLYAYERVPNIENHRSLEGLLLPKQIAELNELLAAITAKYGEYHSIEWLNHVKYILNDNGESLIRIPDAYDHVMKQVQDFAASSELGGGHSNIRRVPSSLN